MPGGPGNTVIGTLLKAVRVPQSSVTITVTRYSSGYGPEGAKSVVALKGLLKASIPLGQLSHFHSYFKGTGTELVAEMLKEIGRSALSITEGTGTPPIPAPTSIFVFSRAQRLKLWNIRCAPTNSGSLPLLCECPASYMMLPRVAIPKASPKTTLAASPGEIPGTSG